MRFFTTEGPVRAEDNYCLPPLQRWDLAEVLGLIEQKKYFLLHAPRQTGKTIPYNDLPGDVYQGILQSIGLPAGFAALLVDVDQKAGDGWLADRSGSLRQLIGRPTTPLAEAVRAALA